MKFIWRTPDDPSLWMIGISSMVNAYTGERSFALHLWRWSFVFLPLS